MAEVLKTIDRFWDARLDGDTAAIHALLAPDATFTLAGRKEFTGISAKLAANALVEAFQFHSREPLWAMVDGLRVATVSRVEVSYRGGPHTTSEVCDLWEFDGDGQVASLKQFADTDLVRRMMAGEVRTT
jgi:ketosteroid isomerase-like protein